MFTTSARLAGLGVIAGAVLALSACGGGGQAVPGMAESATAAGGAATSSGAADSNGSGSGGDQSDGNGSTDGPGGADGAAGRDLPRLVEIRVGTGNTLSSVQLRFEPGQGRPTASIEESNDSTVRRPGSGKPVTLAGQQALRVVVSSAVVGEVQPLDANGPVVAEVRVLGFFEGRTVLGIGIYGDQDLSPRVSFDREEHVLSIVLDNPALADAPVRQCGEVAFAPASEAGAFDITARGVSCEVARDVAAQVKNHAGESYTTDSGFTCLPELVDREPTRDVVYTCSRAGAQITFDI